MFVHLCQFFPVIEQISILIFTKMINLYQFSFWNISLHSFNRQWNRVLISLIILNQMLIAQCNGYEIMRPSAFRLVPYELRFHYAILSAWNLSGKWRLSDGPVQLVAWMYNLTFCSVLLVDTTLKENGKCSRCLLDGRVKNNTTPKQCHISVSLSYSNSNVLYDCNWGLIL